MASRLSAKSIVMPTIIFWEGFLMGRGILLWLLGVPIPIIILLAMCSHH